MYPPEGCPPLAGRKRHACQCPPRPVFCPDRPRPLDPGCAAKPHYTLPEQTGAQSLPGRGTRGGVADPSPVRQPAGSSRRMPRFGASREDPRKARAPIRLVWGQTDAALEPKTPRIFEKAAHLQGYCAAALEKPPLRRFMRAGVAFWANGPSAGAAWFSFRGGENKL